MWRSTLQISRLLALFLFISSIPLYAGLDDLISPEDYNLDTIGTIDSSANVEVKEEKEVENVEASTENRITTPPYDDKSGLSEASTAEESKSGALDEPKKIKPLFERESEEKTETSEATKAVDEKNKQFENTPYNFDESVKKDDFAKSTSSSWIGLMLTVLAGGILFLIYWYQKHLKDKLKSSGVPITILGQTYMDSSTRIVLLKVGNKVLVLAKSPQFCNTLDVITDQDEVNLLTLGSGADQKDFNKILKDMSKQEQKQSAPIPHEAEIRQEINELKQKLGNLS